MTAKDVKLSYDRYGNTEHFGGCPECGGSDRYVRGDPDAADLGDRARTELDAARHNLQRLEAAST